MPYNGREVLAQIAEENGYVNMSPFPETDAYEKGDRQAIVLWRTDVVAAHGVILTVADDTEVHRDMLCLVKAREFMEGKR